MVRSARWVTCGFHLCELVCVCVQWFSGDVGPTEFPALKPATPES